LAILYVFKRVFLQRATHLGTQPEYLLAKYPQSDPNATWIHISYTWTCRERSEREWAGSRDANFTRFI